MRCCATGCAWTSPASLSTRRCFETWGWRRPSRSTISPTARGLRRRSSTICRRFGSARALSVACMRHIYSCRNIPVKVYIQAANIKKRIGEIMQKITTFLWFNDQAEEAMKFYVSVFKNAKILSVDRMPEGTPGPQGKVMSGSFQIEGQEFMVLNGGPQFPFTEAISLFVNCETQAEVDELWDKLSAGGSKDRCGWLKDKYGLSWQVIPTALGRMLRDKDPQKAGRVMQAMLQMSKIDIAALKRAYDQR